MPYNTVPYVVPSAAFGDAFPSSGDSLKTTSSWRQNFHALYQGDFMGLRVRAHGHAPTAADTGVMVLNQASGDYHQHVWLGGQRITFASGDVTGFTPFPTVNQRIDLVILSGDSTGTGVVTGNLRVVRGVEAANPLFPQIPPYAVPLAFIHQKVGAARIVNYEDRNASSGDSFIRQDIRPTFHAEGMASMPQTFNMVANGSFESWLGGYGTPVGRPPVWNLFGPGATVYGVKDPVSSNSGYYAGIPTAPNAVVSGSLAARLIAAANASGDLTKHIVYNTYEWDNGMPLTFSCSINASGDGRAFLRIEDQDGHTDSPFHPGDSQLRLLYVTRIMSPKGGRLKVRIMINSGDSATGIYADGATLVHGYYPAPKHASHPHDEGVIVSNYQDDDYLNFYMQQPEIQVGFARFSGDTGVSSLSRTITYRYTYDTWWAQFATTDDLIGGKRVIVEFDGVNTSSATLRVRTADGAVFDNTNSENVSWMVIGNSAKNPALLG